MEEARSQPKYATIKNQLIQAILGEHFRLASETQAKIKLQALEAEFTHSKNRPADVVPEAVFLWIKDFAITEKDMNKGYKGNFASVYYKEIKGTGEKIKYTLFAKKYDLELKLHPMQMRKKTSHPNWGHPILRLIQKGKKYTTIAAAEKDLQLLHEEYPTTTIPLGNKLNIMVYSKKQGEQNPAEKPIKKHLLEIKSNDDGKFLIEISEKAEKKKMPAQKSPVQKAPNPGPIPTTEPVGKFTSMVQLRRAKKRK